MLRAADQLELSRTALARVLGKDRSTLNPAKGLDPASKTGELALLLIRIYRSLSVLVGNDCLHLLSRCSAPRGLWRSSTTSTPCSLLSERWIYAPSFCAAAGHQQPGSPVRKPRAVGSIGGFGGNQQASASGSRSRNANPSTPLVSIPLAALAAWLPFRQ